MIPRSQASSEDVFMSEEMSNKLAGGDEKGKYKVNLEDMFEGLKLLGEEEEELEFSREIDELTRIQGGSRSSEFIPRNHSVMLPCLSQ